MSSPYNVYFTTRAYLQLVLEISRYPGIETGCVFLGKRIGNSFYVVESVDAGMKANRTPVNLEMDFDYIEHLGDVYRDLYDDASVLGMAHRHPGDYAVFSSKDHKSNAEYARMFDGAISGLINIDPDFRLQIFYVSPPYGKPTLCNTVIIDDSAFEGIISLKDYQSVIASINEHERQIPLLTIEEHEGGQTSRIYSMKKQMNNFVNKMTGILSRDSKKSDHDDVTMSVSQRVYTEIQMDLNDISRYAKVMLDDTEDGSCLVSVDIPLHQEILSFTLFWNDDGKLSLSHTMNGIEKTTVYTDGLLPALLQELTTEKIDVETDISVDKITCEENHVRE